MGWRGFVGRGDGMGLEWLLVDGREMGDDRDGGGWGEKGIKVNRCGMDMLFSRRRRLISWIDNGSER